MTYVLLIDDDDEVRAMVEQMLTQDGHRVSIAKDGEEGLRLAQQKKPELIITDILMPRKDGIETILAMAQAGLTVPIIAMSGGRRGVSAQFNLDSAAMMGVKATLTKPFVRADLRAAIKLALIP
jgi:DNA-binding response OmpR family regulator